MPSLCAMTSDDLLAGRYRPLRLLGTGGMARVFLAEDERLGRRVAVKRLHADSPEEIGRRFQREARLGASLNHQNLVGVYDVETDGESVLIVMEYVEGTTLAAELRDGPLGSARVAAVVSDVAAALDAVHSKGIVHRDVKPANVLIRTDGVAKLADLGIATLVEGTSITVSGTVLGTASYMAPEQLEGMEIGPGADIYALAAVAFEALSGRKARVGETPMQVAHSVTHDPPPDLRDAWPDAPPAVAAALARGMALRPEDRQQRAGQLAAELAAGLREDDAAPTVVRRPPGWIALLAAAVVVVALAGFVLLRGDGNDGPESLTTGSRSPATETSPTPKQGSTAGTETTPTAPPPTTTPTTKQPAGETGAQLNARGYALLRAGNAQQALPLLQRGVDSYPTDSTELEYAFALFNLAQALRQAGRPGEAIPLLERRLGFSDNQRAVVEQELQTARRQAGGATTGTPGNSKQDKPKPGKAKGKP